MARVSYLVSFDVEPDWEDGIFVYDGGEARKQVVLNALRGAAFRSVYGDVANNRNNIAVHSVFVSQPIIEGEERG